MDIFLQSCWDGYRDSVPATALSCSAWGGHTRDSIPWMGAQGNPRSQMYGEIKYILIPVNAID